MKKSDLKRIIREEIIKEGKMKELMMMIDDELRKSNDTNHVAKIIGKELKINPKDIIPFVVDRSKELKNAGQK